MYAKRIDERVYMLDTFALGQGGTVSVYVIKGPRITLIDCGYASSYQNVLNGLLELGISPSEVRYVIPTHVHLDHAGAAGYLLREMPNAEVIAHERAAPHLVDPSKLIQSAKSIFGELIINAYGLPIPIESDRIIRVSDEMHLDLGDGLAATIVHTPGHAPHQVSIMLEGRGILFTADAVGIVYPKIPVMIPTTPPPSFEPFILSKSVDMLSQMDANLLLVPHFGIREDVNNILEETKRKVESWVSEVSRLRKSGAVLDTIVDELTRRVKVESGLDELPIYAEVSIRVSVLGILHFLNKSK